MCLQNRLLHTTPRASRPNLFVSFGAWYVCRREIHQHVGVQCKGEVLREIVWWGGVPKVQILKVGNLSNHSPQEGNHSVNPFRVTPTVLLCTEPVFTQGMWQVWCAEKSLVIEESSSNGDQRHDPELKMSTIFSFQKPMDLTSCESRSKASKLYI